MKDANYVVVQGWMVNQLKLSGNELMVYATIYGFSQDKKSKFKGSLQYVADSFGITRRGVMVILNRLLKKKYIRKFEYKDNGVKYCDYQVAAEFLPKKAPEESGEGGGEKSSPPGEKDSPGVVKKVHQGGEKSSPGGGEKSSPHITKRDNLDINNINNQKIPPDPPVFSTATAVTAETDINDQDKILVPIRSPPKKPKKTDLTPEQLALFHAAKACFETNEKTKSLMYQDRDSTAREMKHLKTLVIRCVNIAPGITADFMRDVLEHFRVMTCGKLKGKAVFTPRALITPWIWEQVIDSLPENNVTQELLESIRGLFK
jgi:hypothetical protein